jgi:hypothetical protein
VRVKKVKEIKVRGRERKRGIDLKKERRVKEKKGEESEGGERERREEKRSEVK